MRNVPNNLHDLVYLVSKIGLAPLRGIFLWFFLAKHSHLPFIGKNVKIISARKLLLGKFVWISHGCYIDAHAISVCTLGDGVTIRENCVIQCRSGLNSKGEGLEIGPNVFIGPFAKIGVGGSVVIGSSCQIGSHFSINAESHEQKGGTYTSGLVSRKGVLIGKDVWVGDKVTILDGVHIGDNCIIGAGAVVTRSFSSNSKIAGIPAKCLN
jgi:acetyltransferase-like isoleucine patch superfamily enzyme